MRTLLGSKTLCALILLYVGTASPLPAQVFTVLNPNGGVGALTQGTDGNLYGTNQTGNGAVFSMTPTGALRFLYNFCPQRGCHNDPNGGLVLGTDGNFYGTTRDDIYRGYGYGIVFKITPSGNLTALHFFHGIDGSEPAAGLILAADGNFYGTTEYGGTHDFGTVFRMTPSGKVTKLYDFCSLTNCEDGSQPTAALVQASDGNFYGTTSGSGGGIYGTIFEITPGGKLTTLHTFSVTDGAGLYTSLIQARDGNLYGTTETGGAYGCGTIFKITLTGQLTTLYSFCARASCADGVSPTTGLVQATDGNFYGTTVQGGGVSNSGTIFQVTPAGSLTTLHSFTGNEDGSLPYSVPVQATNGAFYGMTYTGGAGMNGASYSLSVGLGPFVAFVNAAAKTGQAVGILGQGFTGTTEVWFNGTPSNFTVKSDTLLVAHVPAGAATGLVTVTTPSGILTSNVAFRVVP